MDARFTVEESNLISIFLDENNYFNLENRSKAIEGIVGSIPYLEDSELLELSMRVLEKLRNMSDEEFLRSEFVTAD